MKENELHVITLTKNEIAEILSAMRFVKNHNPQNWNERQETTFQKIFCLIKNPKNT